MSTENILMVIVIILVIIIVAQWLMKSNIEKFAMPSNDIIGNYVNFLGPKTNYNALREVPSTAWTNDINCTTTKTNTGYKCMPFMMDGSTLDGYIPKCPGNLKAATINGIGPICAFPDNFNKNNHFQPAPVRTTTPLRRTTTPLRRTTTPLRTSLIPVGSCPQVKDPSEDNCKKYINSTNKNTCIYCENSNTCSGNYEKCPKPSETDNLGIYKYFLNTYDPQNPNDLRLTNCSTTSKYLSYKPGNCKNMKIGTTSISGYTPLINNACPGGLESVTINNTKVCGFPSEHRAKNAFISF
jgi:hypothetical protein